MSSSNATVTLTDAEQFFYDHAGWGYDPATETPEHGRARGAMHLADAEKHAARKLWSVEWEIDPDADTEPTDSYFVSGNPQWCATLYDEGGNVLASLCGIDFAEPHDVTPEAEPYARVVAAELAYEAI